MPVAVADETHDLPIALFPHFPPLPGDLVNREALAVTGLLELFGKHDWNLSTAHFYTVPEESVVNTL